MIKGTKYWDKDFFSQTNNPTEEMLRKTLKERGGHLESCGPTSAVNIIQSLGYDVDITCPGDYKPQPEEVLTDFMNDKRNYAEFARIRSNLDPGQLPGNRVPQYYPYSVMQVFRAKAEMIYNHDWDYLTGLLADGNGLQFCQKNPGHYIAAQAYDDETDEIIYDDPWKGPMKRMSKADFDNIQSYVIVYHKI